MSYTFNLISDPVNKCTATVDRTLTSGCTALVTVTPLTGYYIINVECTNSKLQGAISSNEFYISNVTGNVTFTVHLSNATKVTNIQPFLCTLMFEKPATVYFGDGTSLPVPCTYDFMSAGEMWTDPVPVSGTTHLPWKLPRGGFKWDRNLNKNAIYIQLPVGDGVNDEANPSNDGGYGYDLGFVQDNIVLTLQTASYLDYQKFMALVKTNTGESVATLTIGYSGTTEFFKVLVRYCNASSNPGSQVITMNVTLTVVSVVYTST